MSLSGRASGPAAGRRWRLRGRPSLLALGALLVAGASGWATWPAISQGKGPPGPHPGKAVYDRECARCHGPGGQADGPDAQNLPIKPPSFADGRLMNPLPDDFLFTVIARGAGAVGLAPQMPGFQPPLTDRQIHEVIGYLRTLAVPPYTPPAVARAVVPVAPAPRQPIEFSHVVHAGSYGIACQYCHADARRSTYAGLPSVERCMGCHKIVAAAGIGDGTPANPDVGKLHDHWKAKTAIPWVRIHKLRGFVYFPHKRHVQVGLACQECHGPVERMQRVAQVAPLTMGWCVTCHAERQGPLDCVVCHH